MELAGVNTSCDSSRAKPSIIKSQVVTLGDLGLQTVDRALVFTNTLLGFADIFHHLNLAIF